MNKIVRLFAPSIALFAASSPLVAIDLYWDTTGTGIWTATNPANWSETPGGGQTANAGSFANFNDQAIFWENTTDTVQLAPGGFIVAQNLIVQAGDYTIDINGEQLWNGFFGIQVDAGASLKITDTDGSGFFNMPTSVETYTPPGGSVQNAWPNNLTVNGTMEISADIQGVVNSRIVMDGTGTLILSGTSSLEGARVESGTLIATRAAALGGYDISVDADSDPGLPQPETQITDTVRIDGGTLGVQVGGAGWTDGEINTLLTNATKTSGALGIDTSNGNYTSTNVYTDANLGGLNLKKLGDNTLTVNTANTYTSATILEGGILQADIADVAATSGALGNGGAITFAGGTLQLTANSAGSDYSARIKNSTRAIAVDTNGQDVTWTGLIDNTNTAGLIKEGAGLLDIRSSDTDAVSPSLYSGTTTVNEGTLRLSHAEDLSGFATNSFSINNGATLEFLVVNAAHRSVINDKTFTFGNSGGGTINYNQGNHLMQGHATHNFVTTGGAQNQITSSNNGFINGQNVALLQFDVADGTDDVDLLLSAAVSNAAFSKRGAGKMAITSNIGGGQGVLVEAGTLTLSGANSYTGATTVSGGTLFIDGDQRGATGAVTVEDGGILSGVGTIGGATTIEAGGILAAGNSPGTLNFNDNLTVDAGAEIIIELVDDTIFDVLNGDSANVLTIAGSILTIDLASYAGSEGDDYAIFTNWASIVGDFASINTINGAGDFTYDDGVLTAVPESGTFALFAGLIGLSYVMVRRRG